MEFNNNDDKQLLKDALDFINSKPKRKTFNPNKELSKVNPEFLEKIQKKLKSNENEAQEE